MTAIIAKQMKYDTVLFDWDGCLVQTHQLWIDVYSKELSNYNLKLTTREIVEKAGEWEFFSDLGIKDVIKFRSDINKEIAKAYKAAELYNGAKELLKYLHENNIKVGIVSNSSRADINKLLTFHGIKSYICVVVGGEDVIRHKPSPDPILLALQTLGSIIEKAVMIGDSSKDIDAARASSIESILIYPPDHNNYYSKTELLARGPTFTASGLNEILEIIE